MLELGLYEEIVSRRLAELLEGIPADQQGFSDLDPGDAHDRLARYLAVVLRSVWKDQSGDEAEKLLAQVALCNDILQLVSKHNKSFERVLDNEVVLPPRELRAIYRQGKGYNRPPQPVVPLTESALFVNDGERINVGAAIKLELASADAVDLICAFVNFNGARLIGDEVHKLCERGTMRLITTTYMGATQRRALDYLHERGVQIKIAYEVPPSSTKLHAKAWLFRRHSGFHTAYIGSSNISHSALVDGLEWNVRLSQSDAEPVLSKFVSTFERYWADKSFESYDPERDTEKLDRALKASPDSRIDMLGVMIDIEPKLHQKEILEDLLVAREKHHRFRNLVVAATGTGKTFIAAFDYQRQCKGINRPRLLFVAHRKEILNQAMTSYRLVLRDHSFGEQWVDGAKPTLYNHVFASIQSLSRFDLSQLKPDHFDIVVIDEFHHAEAETYRRLLDYVQPKILLGLTATPERADGKDVRDLFGGKCDSELRLWDALESELLCPFHYFGIADNTDLRDVEWVGGKYSTSGLEDKLVRNGLTRAALVLTELTRKIDSISAMRCIGFCVSIRHAHYMADQFKAQGVSCAALSSETPSDERQNMINRLRKGDLNIIFAVDIFNEGIDLPEVDTVLFLRPTESATVYIQQLGRGLRRHEGKSCLTVLDFIGMQNRQFRFENRYRAMTGLSRQNLQVQIERDFVTLPAGCNITLDAVSKKHVLENIRAALPSTTPKMVAELRNLAGGSPDYPLSDFLYHSGLEPEDLYQNRRYYHQLKRAAGIVSAPQEESERKLGSGIRRLLGVDDEERVSTYLELLNSRNMPAADTLNGRDRRKLFMLLYGLFMDVKMDAMDEAMNRLWSEPATRREITELLTILGDRSSVLTRRIDRPGLRDVPLQTHGTYTKDESVAAFGENPAAVRQGVRYFEDQRTEVFWVTLRKTEKDYSPSTMYQDYPISQEEFHWESQSVTKESHSTGQRYINHAAQGSNVILMVRESKKIADRTSPYVCLGTAGYLSHESEMPMKIRWKLDTPMPETLFQRFRTAAG